MIKIDFSSAISLYLSFSIFLVFALWIFYNYRKSDILNEAKYLQQCPYCTYMFFNYAPETPPKAQGIEEGRMDIPEESLINSETSRNENPKDLKSNTLICPKCNSYIDL